LNFIFSSERIGIQSNLKNKKRINKFPVRLLLLEGSSGTLLGEALVTDELGADTLEVGVTLGLHLLDSVAVSLLVCNK
jgi:hypothetical protein